MAAHPSPLLCLSYMWNYEWLVVKHFLEFADETNTRSTPLWSTYAATINDNSTSRNAIMGLKQGPSVSLCLFILWVQETH